MNKKIRLDRFLSNQGLGTRSESRKFVFKGLVTVNGEVNKSIDSKVDPETDVICLNGKNVSYQENVYLLLNKPEGCITSTEDKNEKTVMDYIEHPMKKTLFPVGRLDKDTTGLLLITDDGKLSHALLSPKKHVNKTYIASVSGVVDEDTIKAFAQGIIIDDGYKTMPSLLKVIEHIDSNGHQISMVEVTIKEGKFHQIKRMFESVSMEVLTLKRISMGSLVLDEALRIGHFRELTEDEIRILKSGE